MRKYFPQLLLIFTMALCIIPEESSAQNEPMLHAGIKLIKELNPEQLALAVLPLTTDERYNWHFIPRSRKGLSLKRMQDKQKDFARQFLKSGLSIQGYEKAVGIVELEGILNEIELWGFLRRDPQEYYFTLFGSPEENSTWGWRFEGHHISLNFTIVNGRPASQTPAFWGANPALVPKGPKKGWRVLAEEENTARKLIQSLDSTQRKQAVISDRAPRDIITGTGRKAIVEKPEGIRRSALTEEQQNILWSLILVYTENFRSDLAENQKKKIRDSGLQNLHFAWAGGLHPGQGHYYRIQGPTVLIEYDNTQNGANHIHTVFRDLQNDFGEDLLNRHYREHNHD